MEDGGAEMAAAAKKSQNVLDIHKVGLITSSLRDGLSSRVIGQPDAITAVQDIYSKFAASLNQPGKPSGNFLLLGPTGSGKTKIVEALAEVLLNNQKAVIKIDCGEFQHSHEIAKLVGSPPGYLGHRETHPMLSQQIINQYQTETCKLGLILFDEIEKASDAVFKLLLGILDKATLTLGDNRKVNFEQCFIFMTSNLGVREAKSIITGTMGYDKRSVKDDDIDLHNKNKTKTDASIMQSVRKKFDPEFINRLDKIIIFNNLSMDNMKEILNLELAMIQNQIISTTITTPFQFMLTDEAKTFVLKHGISAEYGARYLKRALDKYVVQPFSNLINSEQLSSGDSIIVDYIASDVDELTFEKIKI